MVGQVEPLRIVHEKAGPGTGDRLYKTSDGRWWEKWDSCDRTGQEIRTKRGRYLDPN